MKRLRKRASGKAMGERLRAAMDAATERARRDLSLAEKQQRWRIVRKTDGGVVDAFVLRFDALEPEDDGCACAAVAALHRLGFRVERET